MITKGSIVTFGKYYQISNITKDDIEWIVLDESEEKVLLVSRLILDTIAYNDQMTGITWENCTLSVAFSSEEQSFISNSRIKNVDNLHPLRMALPDWMQQYNPYGNTVSGGNDTIDKVFILSWEEAIKYFPNHPNSDRIIMDARAAVASFHPKDMTVVARALSGINVDATDYAKSHGLDIYAGSATIWFRSPGNTSQMAVTTMMGDILYRPGCEVDDATNGVRPALWVSKKAFMDADKLETVEKRTEDSHKEEQISLWKRCGRCQYCGGVITGLFIKKCLECGRKKDY